MPAYDQNSFTGPQPGSSGSAASARAVTPNDSTNLSYGPARALYVGGAGDVTVIAEFDAGAVTFTAVPAGFILPVRVTRVMAAGTTANAIVALY